jgi:hypothetical protein
MAQSVLELRHYPMKSINLVIDKENFQNVYIHIQCRLTTAEYRKCTIILLIFQHCLKPFKIKAHHHAVRNASGPQLAKII